MGFEGDPRPTAANGAESERILGYSELVRKTAREASEFITSRLQRTETKHQFYLYSRTILILFQTHFQLSFAVAAEKAEKEVKP
jgi:hypothetical protein